MKTKPRIAVWKFASCDGCQLSLIDLDEQLLDFAATVEVAYFVEVSRALKEGPYDISIIDGSMAMDKDQDLLRKIRAQSRFVVAIGACASQGGIQSLRNFASVSDFAKRIYRQPEWLDALEWSTPIRENIKVDFELQGCPVNKNHILEVVAALSDGRKPVIGTHSVCLTCKLRGTTCVLVAGGVPCMGPVTQDGCGAICPGFNRGCYGCFGPMETANIDSFSGWLRKLGVSDEELVRMYRTFNAWSADFRHGAQQAEERLRSKKEVA
jgi:coenzyme F420-reducing hydrogenase gamma subunit